MLYSSQCEYAIRALTRMALHFGEGPVSAKTLAETENIPFHFLAKILQDLSRRGLLLSKKGPRGGFVLARPPEEITAAEIVEIVDGLEFMNRCAVGYLRCCDETPCPQHDLWMSVRKHLENYLENTTLAEMGNVVKYKIQNLEENTDPAERAVLMGLARPTKKEPIEDDATLDPDDAESDEENL
ncbi:MAG: Rrf2 family transcriptional regulator [Verrucomicrobiota bacterium]|jgi:Rrf2 family iron-sulfur cluster assembly transcriptional regulator|nr:Rrf2 family transcriptional regulator [Verrucomicrobiota bacterium]